MQSIMKINIREYLSLKNKHQTEMRDVGVKSSLHLNLRVAFLPVMLISFLYVPAVFAIASTMVKLMLPRTYALMLSESP